MGRNERGMRIRCSISINFKTMAAETRVNEVVGNNGLHTYTCGHTHTLSLYEHCLM